MRESMIANRWLLLAVATAIGALASYAILRSPKPDLPLHVALPVHLSAAATEGQKIFAANCQKCHGSNAAGSDQGPPLVHRIYEPHHHADISFERAVEFGVKAHHWRFGDMPPVSGVSKDQVALVVDYVRELQRANGIQ
ncbi:MAG: cytochrome c [Hyphomicrobiaceae bacterium]